MVKVCALGHNAKIMKCLDCPYMACKVFYHKTEIWEGFCMNEKSCHGHKKVTGNSSCEDQITEKIIRYGTLN